MAQALVLASVPEEYRVSTSIHRVIGSGSSKLVRIRCIGHPVIMKSLRKTLCGMTISVLVEHETPFYYSVFLPQKTSPSFYFKEFFSVFMAWATRIEKFFGYQPKDMTDLCRKSID